MHDERSGDAEIAGKRGGHGGCYGEVKVCAAGEEGFVGVGDADDRIAAGDFESEYGPAEIVPVDYELRIAEKTDERGDEEDRDGRWVLNERPFCSRGSICEDEPEVCSLEDDFQRGEKDK